MMNKIFNFFLSFVLTAFFAIQRFATKVVWWMENATIPSSQDKYELAFNAEHDDIELNTFLKKISMILLMLLSGSGPDIFDTPGAFLCKNLSRCWTCKIIARYADQFGWKDKLIDGLTIQVCLMVNFICYS